MRADWVQTGQELRVRSARAVTMTCTHPQLVQYNFKSKYTTNFTDKNMNLPDREYFGFVLHR